MGVKENRKNREKYVDENDWMKEGNERNERKREKERTNKRMNPRKKKKRKKKYR